jgi:ubiquinone/menaquinone biosynthesis C-methylase UbiE
MNNKFEYQHNLSVQSPILLDKEYKQPKVLKMLAVLKDAGLIEEKKKKLAVDIGCSGGFFASELARYFDQVVGFDIDIHALRLAHENIKSDNLAFVVGDSLRLPLADNSVDLIVCNHVYEHVPDPEQMFREIYRVLNIRGGCYLGSASKLTFIEPHYHLPILSWLPKSLAHKYMKLSGKGEYYYENLRNYKEILKLIQSFVVQDYTLRIIKDPDMFHAYDLLPESGFLRKVPLTLWKICYKFLPTYIFILKKNKNETDN